MNSKEWYESRYPQKAAVNRALTANILDYMEKSGVTVEDAAGALGMSPYTFRKYRYGERLWRGADLAALASLLGVLVGDFFEGNNTERGAE